MQDTDSVSSCTNDIAPDTFAYGLYKFADCGVPDEQYVKLNPGSS